MKNIVVHLLLLVVIWLVPPMALSVECEPYGEQISWKSSIGSSGMDPIIHNAFSWPYYYSLLQDGTVVVFDVADSENPFIAESFELPFSAYRIHIKGDMLLATSREQIATLDISDPLHPVQRDTSSSLYYPRDSCLAGDQAWIVTDYRMLNILDTTLSSNLQVLGQLEFSDTIVGVIEYGGFAYVETREGLYVVDFYDPALPVQLSFFPGDDGSMVLAGNKLLINVENQTSAYDLSNPGVPVLLENSETEMNGYLLGASDGHVVFFDYWAYETHVYSVDNEGVLEFMVAIGDESYNWDPVFVTSSNLYFPEYNKLSILAFGINETTRVLASLTTPGLAYDMAVRDGYGFAAVEEYGFSVFDLTDPENPVFAGSGFTPHTCYYIALEGNRAILAGGGGLSVLDISDPTLPYFFGATLDLDSQNTSGLAVYNQTAWVGGGYQPAMVVDISDPSSPVQIATMESLRALTIDEGYLHAVDQNSVYHIYSLENSLPLEVGSLQLATLSNYLDVDGPWAVVEQEGGFWLLDVSDPAQPVLVEDASVMDYNHRLNINGNIVTVSAYHSIQILEISENQELVARGSVWAKGGIGHNVLPGGEILVRKYSDYLYEGSFSIYPPLCLTPTSVPEQMVAGPEYLSIYPNPFNPQTTISFTLPYDAEISLNVYDLTGHLVDTIIGGSMVSAGSHTWSWDGRDISGCTVASGVYLVQLLGDGIQASGRMALIR
jgi:hypothetical protein